MSAMLNLSNNDNFYFLTDFDQTCINFYGLLMSSLLIHVYIILGLCSPLNLDNFPILY